MSSLKYWEIIADRLSANGFTWGYCSAVTPQGLMFVVDVLSGDGARFVVQADDLLCAFLELEATLLKTGGELSTMKRKRPKT